MGWSLKYLGNLTQDDHLNIYLEGKCVLSEDRVDLQKAWNEVSWQIARMRDNPECADSEYALISDKHNGGLVLTMGFDPEENLAAPFINTGVRPKVAILREQGVNSQNEMASAFLQAGFDAVDVHMTDLLEGRAKLADFVGLAACGGFSYGDVLGAGGGWAKTILHNAKLQSSFRRFFETPDNVYAGRLQRLSDDFSAQGSYPRVPSIGPLSSATCPSSSKLVCQCQDSRVTVYLLHGYDRAPPFRS